ncbi:hypothetical protein F4V89_25345 [Neorhizobium galegae]|nr:hypothetical protein F4V88_30725 [Neorhizobium galegae]KAB1110066.1 hypothetical protein F4V89_25345 [Neorhizobium galegae]
MNLSSELAYSPYLQEYYGSVTWAVCSIDGDYVEWFDRTETNLHPLPAMERAQDPRHGRGKEGARSCQGSGCGAGAPMGCGNGRSYACSRPRKRSGKGNQGLGSNRTG